MANVGPKRVHSTGQQAPAERHRAAAPATLHASVLSLGRSAGNRAVARLLQRKVGWTDASKKGRAWNLDERAVGKIRRIPLENLAEGLGDQARIGALSSEGAKGKAIVLVPNGLDATKPIEVMVFLHGWTEDQSTRPYAGWRALDTRPTPARPKMKDLRRGVDPALVPGVPDIAPVRDVALDQAEQQLEESGHEQLVIVLPQGGLTSEFDKASARAFDAKNYVGKIKTRLHTEGVWKDDKGNAVKDEPTVSRVIMAGHSGAGAALSVAAKAGDITRDLVIYDAINGPGERKGYLEWASRRLEEDLIAIKAAKTDADVLRYLQAAPKLRGYATGYRNKDGQDRGYIVEYMKLDDAIQTWFDASRTELGKWAGCLRRNYCFEYYDVEHEELMRGSDATNERVAGTGNILDAIRALHAPAPASAACPMPKSLRQRYDELQAKRKAEREAKAKEEQRRRAEQRRGRAGVR